MTERMVRSSFMVSATRASRTCHHDGFCYNQSCCTRWLRRLRLCLIMPTQQVMGDVLLVGGVMHDTPPVKSVKLALRRRRASQWLLDEGLD